MRADLTAIQVKALVDHLRDVLGEDLDDQTLLDGLEGETDLFEFASRLLDKIETDEGVKAALVQQIKDRNDRKARAEQRIEHFRETLRGLMETAGVEKLPLPEATVTLRSLDDKLVVTDKEAVADEYKKPKYEPDMEAINGAFADPKKALPNWLRRETDRVSLTIRRR